MRSLAVLTARSVREVLGSQPTRLPQLRAAAWGQTHRTPVRTGAMNTRERGDAGREGTLGGPGILRELGPVQVEPLTCDVGTWRAVKSKRQAHLWWHLRSRVEQVIPFVGAEDSGGRGGRKQTLTLSSEDICHSACMAGSSRLSHICHLAHAIWVIFEVPLSARNHPPSAPLV